MKKRRAMWFPQLDSSGDHLELFPQEYAEKVAQLEIVAQECSEKAQGKPPSWFCKYCNEVSSIEELMIQHVEASYVPT